MSKRKRRRCRKEEGNPVIATGTKPIVKYTGVTKSFGDLQVLKGIDLEMPGEKVAVIGPSGSGKTTMGRMLMTLEEPTEGTIEVDGEPPGIWKRKGSWFGPMKSICTGCAQCRHGLPAFQSVPAHERASQCDGGPAQSAGFIQGGGGGAGRLHAQ